MTEKKKTILIVDDEPEILRMLSFRLSTSGYEILTAKNGLDGLEKAKSALPDLILLDIMMPKLDGLQVKERLNREEATADIPVIFLSALGTPSSKVEGFRLKADDYIVKPFESTELLARIEVAINRRRNYEALAFTDGLTGLQNVHFFKKQFHTFFNLAKRYKRVFSLVLMDINNLKKINDTYGHLAGDSVIQLTAQTMKDVFREADILVRYGGDEFVVLFPETVEAQASNAVKRFKEKIQAEQAKAASGGQKIAFSISAGIASYDENMASEAEIFELADKNMYEDKMAAKRGGL